MFFAAYTHTHTHTVFSFCVCVSKIGPKTVYLVVIDGGADWMAAKDMVRSKFPWIYFLHCVAHEGSLIVKDICKIEEVGACMCIMCMPIYMCMYARRV